MYLIKANTPIATNTSPLTTNAFNYGLPDSAIISQEQSVNPALISAVNILSTDFAKFAKSISTPY